MTLFKSHDGPGSLARDSCYCIASAELAHETRTKNRADRVIKLINVAGNSDESCVGGGWCWSCGRRWRSAWNSQTKVRLDTVSDTFLSIPFYTHVYGMILPRAKLVLELALPGRFYHVLPHSAWGLRPK